jgi:hypothetical protein
MYGTAVKDALDVKLPFYNPRFEGDGKSRLQRQPNGVITLDSGEVAGLSSPAN